MPRRLERAFLDSEVEMLELVVPELLENLRKQGQRRVGVRLLCVLLKDGLQVTQLATS